MRILTLTRSKQIELACHALLTSLLLWGRWFAPLPAGGRWAVGILAALGAAGILAAAFWPKEKQDERGARNAARADSLTLELLYTGVALCVFATLFTESFSVTFYQLVLGFSITGLLRSLFFLLFERFGA